MRMVFTIDPGLIARARDLSDIADQDELMAAALRALAERGAAELLILMGATEGEARYGWGATPPPPVVPDLSAWIGHLRHGSHALTNFLRDGRVLAHPHVASALRRADLAGGNAAADAMAALRPAPVADRERVDRLMQAEGLDAPGVDRLAVHALASALLEPDGTLFTLDDRLRAVAERLGVAVE